MEPRPDTRALLDQLRIDRTAPQKRNHRPLWLLLAPMVVGAALWVLLQSDPSDTGADNDTTTPNARTTGTIPSAPTASAAPAAPATTAKPSEPANSATPNTNATRTAASSAVGAAAGASTTTSVLDATGYVIARRQATVSAQVTGQVTEVYVEEGQSVVAGEVLARLDDAIPQAQRDLVAAQLAAQRATARELDAQYAQAERDLARTRNLAERNLASAAALERDVLALDALAARRGVVVQQVQVAEKNLALQDRALDDMTVRAPFAGVVIAKAAQPGEIISPISAGGGFTRTGICTIVDMDSLEVEVDVNEAYINRVEPGQPVQVTLNAYPDTPYAATVIAIIPAADRNKATVRVRIRLLERDARVLPDMGVRVAFLAPETGA